MTKRSISTKRTKILRIDAFQEVKIIKKLILADFDE
jgi:hypothetical protein